MDEIKNWKMAETVGSWCALNPLPIHALALCFVVVFASAGCIDSSETPCYGENCEGLDTGLGGDETSTPPFGTDGGEDTGVIPDTETGGDEETGDSEETGESEESGDDPGPDPVDLTIEDIEAWDLANFEACDEEDVGKLRAATELVLDHNCSSCHGEQGDIPFNGKQTLDLDTLLDAGMFVPGEPGLSKPIARMLSEESPMPPSYVEGPVPSVEQIAIVSQWVTCLAEPQVDPGDEDPEQPPSFITDDLVLEWMNDDLQSHQLSVMKHIRYISLANLRNAGKSWDDLETYRQGLTKLLNSMSWNEEITPVTPVDEQGIVVRIDLRDYSWDEIPVAIEECEEMNAWRFIEESYPYAIEFDSNDFQDLVSFTESTVPFVQADWFAANISVPPLYHDILCLPEHLDTLEELFGIDIQENIDQREVVRAGMLQSNVSVNNRAVERHELGLGSSNALGDSYFGVFWLSYDFSGNDELQSIIEHPVDFEAAGGEVIFSLPNGFQAYYICDEQGNRLDSAPTNIVADKGIEQYAVAPDVVTGLSCMSCHYNGMNEAVDEIRDIVLDNLSLFPDDISSAALQLYVEPKDFNPLMAEDQARFEEALEEAGLGLVARRKDEPITQLAYPFGETLNLSKVAASFFMTKDEFLQAEGLDRLKKARAQISNLVKEPGKVINRAAFDEAFRDASCFLGLGDPITPGTEESGCTVVKICNTDDSIQGTVTLRITGAQSEASEGALPTLVEFQALESKCSPCRNVPVGSVINGTLAETGSSNEQHVEFSFEDEDELVIEISRNQSTGELEATTVKIDSQLTCDDI